MHVVNVVYSVCDDAGVHPGGQRLHEKHPETVPNPLNNGSGKLVLSINQ